MEPLNIFERYPQLCTLRGKVPDEIIEREVNPKAELFEYFRPLANQKIPTVRLCEAFPLEVENARITLEKFLGQWGNISIEELCKICLIVAWLKPRAVFEIGTYNGMTTRQMAMNSPADCHIYTLDIPPNEVSELEIGDIDCHLAQKVGAFQFEVGHYFKGTSFERNITQLWGDSLKIDLSKYKGQMDVVFVDAGHTYSYVKSDTENAFRMLRPGGVILWHDYLQVLHPDVTRHLYEVATYKPIYHLRGTNLALYYEQLKSK